MLDLPLVRVPHAHHRFFHSIRGIFSNLEAKLRWHQHGNPTRLAQFQRPRPITVHKSLLHGRMTGGVVLNHLRQPLKQRKQTTSQGSRLRLALTIGHMPQFAAVHIHKPPACGAQTRINAQYPHGNPLVWSSYRLSSTKREHLKSSHFGCGAIFMSNERASS